MNTYLHRHRHWNELQSIMKKIELHFFWDELLSELAAETYHRGKTIENGENYRKIHELMATADNKVHTEKLWASACKGYGELQQAMSEYLTSSSATSGSHSPGFEASDLILPLTFPNNWNSGLVESLSESAHAYLRNRILTEWYAVTEPEMSASYAALAAGSLNEVIRCIHSRIRPMR